jgi:predicted dehydrogenase
LEAAAAKWPGASTLADYKALLELELDAVIIATPWELHVPIAVATMEAGKHALVEVPAAITVEGCWELVETAQRTGKECMMLENVCYGREELMVLNMCRREVFGELLHGEAAYIHDLRAQMHHIEHGTGSWRTAHYTKRNGNLYPTHGLGPIAQAMNINRGDRFDFLCSVSSPSRAREIYAREHFYEGDSQRKLHFICGDINTTIIKTELGRTIMLQWDEQLPRPYSRLNLIQGTRGVWAGFPNRLAIESQSESWIQGSDLDPWFEKYEHALWKQLASEAAENGGHGGMDFVMLWRIVYCLRTGEPLDQDVYDAASWSVIGPLTEESVAHRGRTTDVPDFTRGGWRRTPPKGIIP